MRKLRQLQALARRSYWQESDARRIVDAWRRSGETVSRFAGELGLDPRRVSDDLRRVLAVLEERTPC
jgi:hypothetical protein